MLRQCRFARSSTTAGGSGQLVTAGIVGAFEFGQNLLPGPLDSSPVLFLTDFAAMRAAERPGRAEESRGVLLDEAIAAFRAILVECPGLVRVRLELARAFFLKREDSLAREHFEPVLAGRPRPAVDTHIL